MPPLEFLSDPEWRRSVLTDGFGKGFWGFLLVAVLTGIACYAIRGPEAFFHALERDGRLLLGLMPRVVVALSIAALIWFLLPRDKVSALVGKESGLKGLLVATAAGTVTPGGPSSAYALLAVLAGSGADRGAMVAYITAWATLGLQRILVWDVPFMGPEFAFLRVLVSLPLPIIAGLIARRLPFELRVKDADGQKTEARA
ncbi:MAG: permease [Rhodobacteraceae bacterium]|nr:permease [Paracoccaceae bacterium]